jgi:hypothetical protein
LNQGLENNGKVLGVSTVQLIMMVRKKIAPLLLLSMFSVFTACEKTEQDISTADRDKFLGTWNAVSTGSGGTRNFQMVINASNSAPEQVIIKGFDGGNTNSNLPASVSGNDIALITTVISGETIAGNGRLSGDTLRIDFTLDDGQTIENRICKAWK